MAPNVTSNTLVDLCAFKEGYQSNCTTILICDVPSGPTIVHVDDDFNTNTSGWGYDHFASIQQGINAVAEQGIVYVHNGIYYENIQIHKTISVLGESRSDTIIVYNSYGYVVSVIEDDVTFAHFTLRDNFDDNDSNSTPYQGLCVQSRGSNISDIRIIDTNIGICIQYSTANTISDCIIQQNSQQGILITHSSQNIIKKTIVQENGIGVSAINSIQNLLYHNNFIDNAAQARDTRNNTWDNGYPSGGNYWSDYTGSDYFTGPQQNINGSDGIGDVPYIIPGGSGTDRYPLMRPYGQNTSIVEVTNLNTHEKFSSIQAAIDDPDTIDGHTILVGIGTFYENVIITKSITLQGTAVYDSIIDGRGIGDVVSILVDNVIVTHLTIRNSGPFPLSGVNVWSSRNNISTNMITGNGNGIYCSHTSFTGIYDNLITNNALGIFLTYSWHNVISHNILEGNREYGLNVMVSSNRNSISNNMILGNRNAGISLYNVSMNVLQQNIVAWNGIGVLQSYSNSNLFYHNNFINNTRQVGGHNTSYNIWDLGYPIGGNYWSDYTGIDANGDGIGDTPYYICEGNIDHYPLMTEYILRK